MTRRWFAWLPFVGAAMAQIEFGTYFPPKRPRLPVDDGIEYVLRKTPDNPDTYQWVAVLAHDEHPTPNGQCPVCGLVREEKVPPKLGKMTCSAPNQCDFEATPQSIVVRCSRCSAAFWQDSEEAK